METKEKSVETLDLSTLPPGSVVKVETETSTVYWLTVTSMVQTDLVIDKDTKAMSGIMLMKLPTPDGKGHMDTSNTPQGGPYLYEIVDALKVGGRMRVVFNYDSAIITSITVFGV